MNWREFAEPDARKLTPNQIAWRKRKYLESLSEVDVMDWAISKKMKLVHVTELPTQDEYYEFFWIKREPEDD